MCYVLSSYRERERKKKKKSKIEKNQKSKKNKKSAEKKTVHRAPNLTSVYKSNHAIESLETLSNRLFTRFSQKLQIWEFQNWEFQNWDFQKWEFQI